MSEDARTGAAGVARTVAKTLWNPSILADAANYRRMQAGKPPAPQAAMAAVKAAAVPVSKAVENFRSTSIIRPDGTREKIIIHSPAERMKTYYFGVKIVAFVLAILFAGSIFQFIGQQMAGHSADIAIGAGKEYARRLGL